MLLLCLLLALLTPLAPAPLPPADLTLTTPPAADLPDGMVDVLLTSHETGDAVLTLIGVPRLVPLAVSEGGGCRTRTAETICEWAAGGVQPRTLRLRLGVQSTLTARLAIWNGGEATRHYPASADEPPLITVYGTPDGPQATLSGAVGSPFSITAEPAPLTIEPIAATCEGLVCEATGGQRPAVILAYAAWPQRFTVTQGAHTATWDALPGTATAPRVWLPLAFRG